MFRDCCREGYLQSGRIKEAGKFTVFFLPGHGPRPGWTAVADGGPGVSVFGSGSFHEAGLSKAFCLVQSKLCAITLRAVLSGRNRAFR